jgi:hypothetical protein
MLRFKFMIMFALKIEDKISMIINDVSLIHL